MQILITNMHRLHDNSPTRRLAARRFADVAICTAFRRH